MFFSQPTKGSLILILDIQSSVVRASLVHMQGAEIPQIIFTYSKNVPYRPGTGSGRLVSVTVSAVKEIMGAVLQFMKSHAPSEGFPKKIDGTHYVLSSPWVISQAKTISVTFPQSTEVSAKLISGIIGKERSKLIPNAEMVNNKIDIIEEKVFNIELNGYSVTEWKGKRTKKLDISFAVSIAGNNTSELFRDACTIVPRKKIFFHSSLLLQQIAIQHLMPHKSAYTLIHVHGELTDVAVINHHSCTFFGSYPVGVYTVIRRIAEGQKTDVQLADSSLTLYTQQNMDPSYEKSAAVQSTEEAGEFWSTEFRKIFGATDSSVKLPTDAIICGHVHEGFFARSIKNAYPYLQTELLTLEEIEVFVRYTASTEPIRVSGLYTMALHSIMQHEVI